MSSRIVNALLGYVPCPNFRRRLKHPNLAAWGLSEPSVRLLEQDPNAFLIGAIFDRQIKAEKAWEIPYKLNKRLGHLDSQKISKMDTKDLAKFIGRNRYRTGLHRFPNQMADCVIKACKLLIEKYEGNAANVWRNHPIVATVLDNLTEFKGISQKIGNMVVRLLITYYGVSLTGWNKIDVAVDRHVARVFLRTGLVNPREGKTKYAIAEIKESVIKRARELFPQYPGALDEPAFLIGKYWCTAEEAYCDDEEEPCPLTKACPKRTNLQVS